MNFWGGIMADILLKDLWKIFKSRGEVVEAVKGINLHVMNGELVVLLGPSGCGKTTTLRMIAGLEKPTFGSVFIDGENVTKLTARQRDIAFVFQSYALYPHLTVYQNVEFPLKAQGMSKDVISKRVKEIMDFLGIWEFKDKYPSNLDSGAQQKVAIARAIVRKPKAFLLDEPLSNLDAKVREYTRAELKRLHMDINITTIYVTHDQIEAMSLADRIVVMKLGEIQQVGKPREVYENPNNLFVANFIGSPGMNFFRVVKDGNYLILEDYRINVNELKKYRRILSGMNDGEMILGIRPEYIKLSNSRNGWQVKIDLVEPLGFEKIVDFLGKRTSGKLRTLKRVNLKPSDEVRILFDIEKIRLFDPKTGWNLLRMDQVDEVKVS